MASIRALRPLARQTPRLITKSASLTNKRFLNIETAPVLFTSHATATGGRAEGHVKGDHLDIKLDMPKAAGGPGKESNPEELFAAGYGACFQGAMAIGAKQAGVTLANATDFSIETDVHLIGDMSKADLGIRVDMKVHGPKGMSKADLEKVVEKTKEVCPYSRATKGNVITNVEVVAS